MSAIKQLLEQGQQDQNPLDEQEYNHWMDEQKRKFGKPNEVTYKQTEYIRALWHTELTRRWESISKN